MNKFEIILASVPDREDLVAEIWHEGDLIAEVNKEKGYLELEFFSQSLSNKLIFKMDELCDVLIKVKNKLNQ